MEATAPIMARRRTESPLVVEWGWEAVDSGEIAFCSVLPLDWRNEALWLDYRLAATR